MTRFITLLFIIGCCQQSAAQLTDSNTIAVTKAANENVYNIKPWIDIPLSAVGTGWTLYGFSVIYGRDSVPYSELAGLDRNKVNSFDKGATRNYSLKAKSASDIFFYGSMPLHVLLLLDKDIRRDGIKVGLLYLEAMSITGTIYTLSAMSANRFRPYAYNPDVPLSVRSRGGARNSFYAGHVALVGTSTFFMAKVLSDYNPSMKNKWILYTIAGGATLSAAILRVKAGQHFPSDAIVGAILGPASGILVPHFHKNKKMQKLTLQPYFDGNASGVSMVYKLP